jgi:hypothetical protein
MIVTLISSGCVRRRLTVRSNPTGALVYIDDQEIGKTPVSTSFTYYGTRKIRLVRDGYETLTVMQKVRPPWYQLPPLDFLSENLYPGELRDERWVEFDLQPQRTVPRSELLDRANQLRTSSQVGYNEPVPVGIPNDLDRASSPGAELAAPESREPPPFYPDDQE